MNAEEIKAFIKQASKKFIIMFGIPCLIVVGILIFFVSVAYIEFDKKVFESTDATSDFKGSITMDMENGRSCF